MSCYLFDASKRKGIKPVVDGVVQETPKEIIKPITHVIRKGETLSSIAGKYKDITYQEIAKANGIHNPNNIYVGQRITIPNQPKAPTPPPSKPTHKPLADSTSLCRPENSGCCERKSKPWIISQKGIDFLKNYETLKLHMYNDSAGHATIGYGHLIHYGPISNESSEKSFKNGLTKKEAENLLKSDLKKYENAVNKHVNVPLCQQEYDALVIFCFNIGIGAFKKSSALKVLNQHKYKFVGNKMKLYNKAGGKVSKGLKNRRAEEVEIFNKGDYVRTR